MSDFNRGKLEDRMLAEFTPIVTPPATAPEQQEEYYDEEGSSFDKVRIIAPIIILAIVCFVSYAWYTDKFAISRDNSADLPIVKASTEPIREKPEDPGGLKIINRDKRVYDTISGKDNAQDKKVENILPAPEEPISHNEIAKITGDDKAATPELINKLPDDKVDAKDDAKPENITPAAGSNAAIEDIKEVAASAATNQNIAEAPASKNTETATAKAETKAPEPAAPAATEKAPTKTEQVQVASAAPDTAKTITAPTPVAASTDKPAATTETKTEAPAVAKPTIEKAVTADDIKDVTPKKAPKAEEKKAKATHSGYRVQLGSYRSEGDLELSWKNMNKKFPAILSGMSNYVEKADLGAKGIYYRLQISGFKNEADARKTCQALTEKKQECFFVGK